MKYLKVSNPFTSLSSFFLKNWGTETSQKTYALFNELLCGFPLVGSPEHIADLLEQLSATGIAGTTLSFVDYASEFPYFEENVMTLLEEQGLRHKFLYNSKWNKINTL